MNNSKTSVTPFCPNLVAKVTGVDLPKDISENEFKRIKDTFLNYQFLFFQGQIEISPLKKIEFGKKFG